MCLNARKKGLLSGCKSIIRIDGFHLKGQCKGQLLTAVGVDGNDEIFPLAYAIVEIKSKESWIWFLQLLLDDIEDVRWTFNPEEQKK